MSPIGAGERAPQVPGFDGAGALWFYKVTCPVCQMAAPKIDRVAAALPGAVLGVGQDPREALDEFARDYRTAFPSVTDLPPYEVSDAFDIRVVPTLFVVEATGTVVDVVESWDRDGYNRAAARLAELTGGEPILVSDGDDGLPPFRPG